MKNKLKKAFAAFAVASALAVGGTALVAPQTAPRADAATYTNCWSQSVGVNGEWAYFCYVDYNWWEELWGAHDGAVFMYWL